MKTGAPLVSTLSGWARLSISAYIAGGRAALIALADAGYNPLPEAPKPTVWQVFGRWTALRKADNGVAWLGR